LLSDFRVIDQALREYKEVPYDDVSIMAPCFFTDVDRAGAATTKNILFGRTSWISGLSNTLPNTVTGVSSYDIIDELVNYYLDTARFPALEAVVLAGHSAGAQMVQRYALLGKPRRLQRKLHYWVANPGSFAYLKKDRPFPDASCEGFDSWKFGLSDNFPPYGQLDRNTLVERYLNRKVHYAFGEADDGSGDNRCQARTQGRTHIERGRKFMETIDGLGGLRVGSTVDYIPNAVHSGDQMAKSERGKERVRICSSI